MLNRIVIIGRTTKDVELRYSPTGTAIGGFTVACDRPVAKGKDKETDFINVVTFKQTAEACANYLKKGNLVAVEGRLQIRNYEKDNKKIWISEVVADNVKFLERNKDGSESMNRADSSSDPFKGNGSPIDFSESDLPF
jgi:single-strand DNA-binding protein